MKKLNLTSLLEVAFLTSCITVAIMFVGTTIARSATHDFDVFYYSARTSLQGGMFYTTYGSFDLPYWYFPWLAWFYIPLALFPREAAYGIYTAISLGCASISIFYLCRQMAPATNMRERFFVLSMSLPFCWLLFRVGQMDFILLALTVFTMHLIDTGKPQHAGLLVPIFLFKPHLFIVFFAYVAYKGGRAFVSSAALASITLVAVSFLVIRDWPLRMIQLLSQSGQRTDHSWNFTTLPTLLGSQENWSGTANIPFTLVLILFALLVLWKFRTLPTFPLLSVALAGSLFCAPRAYAYNLPFLIPCLIWLSAGLPKYLFPLFWAMVAIAPFLFGYTTGTYFVVLLTFIAAVIKAWFWQRKLSLPKSAPATMQN